MTDRNRAIPVWGMAQTTPSMTAGFPLQYFRPATAPPDRRITQWGRLAALLGEVEFL
jgi:hypothetical protein